MQLRFRGGAAGFRAASARSVVLARPQWAAVSTGQRNTLIFLERWSVRHEVSSPQDVRMAGLGGATVRCALIKDGRRGYRGVSQDIESYRVK